MSTNPYEPTQMDRHVVRSKKRRKSGGLVGSGVWIGLLSIGIGIGIAVWLLRRIPANITLPWSAYVFVGLTVCPYLIVGMVSCFVSSLPAKAVLFAALTALVVTTFWQFSIRDAQAAIIVFYQFPGAIITGAIALMINGFTRSR